MHATDPDDNDATELQALPQTGAADATLAPGARLGPYVIRRVLGEGGMGCVYLAEQQQPVRREVALKLIRGEVASPLARAYFDVERQALAQMQHPAIAQVFDAGTTEQGHAYLAMEVVEGEPITRFCRTAGLDRAERLALFARVCNGVQHAHQKGIIHRDLKPANVLVRLVDGVAMPKIIDFGIAIGGVAEGGAVAAHATATDQAGTAIYMSPEQAVRQPRDLDTRSDVYSLGVMLYEVLTDADAAALTSVVHASRRAPHETLLAAIDSDADVGVAPAPDAFLDAARRLPQELRAILRKALAADRDERYDSAAALADDLERHRQRRPIKAMPQTRRYLARKFASRHRFGLAAASLVALALLAGIALALHGLAQARVEAAKAAQVSDFVRGILAGIDPDRAKGMDTQLMRMVLDDAASRAGRELAGQPDIRAEIEGTVADSYASLGETQVAMEHYDAALDAARSAGLPLAGMGNLQMRKALAVSSAGAGQPQQALPLAHEAAAWVATLPERDRLRLKVESRLASVEKDAGKVTESIARYERVLAMQREAFGADDRDALDSAQGLAIANFIAGRFAEAERLLDDVIARRTRLYGEDDIRVVSARLTLGTLSNEQEHYARAEELMKPLLPQVERVYGAEHPRTLVVLMNLGSAIRYQGHYEEARPYYERSLALAHKLYGPNSPRSLMAEGNMSLMLRDAGDLDAAERHARHVADEAETAFEGNPYRASMYRGLATILVLQGKYGEAERELQRAWDLFESAPAYGPAHPRSQEVVDGFIALYAAWGKPALEAEWVARRVPPPGTSATEAAPRP